MGLLLCEDRRVQRWHACFLCRCRRARHSSSRWRVSPALLANNAHLAMKLLGKLVPSRAISSAATPEYEMGQDRPRRDELGQVPWRWNSVTSLHLTPSCGFSKSSKMVWNYVVSGGVCHTCTADLSTRVRASGRKPTASTWTASEGFTQSAAANPDSAPVRRQKRAASLPGISSRRWMPGRAGQLASADPFVDRRGNLSANLTMIPAAIMATIAGPPTTIKAAPHGAAVAQMKCDVQAFRRRRTIRARPIRPTPMTAIEAGSGVAIVRLPPPPTI
jgi:hypothetical protein